MPDLILRQNFGGPTFATNIVLSCVPPTEAALESQFVDVFWRFDDDATMEPLHLGRGNAGETLLAPFDPKGRAIRLFAASVTERGESLVTDYSKMAQTTYVPKPSPEADSAATFPATETMSAGRFVNVYTDAGVAKIRYANASDNTKPADGFIAEAVTSGDSIEVFFGGRKNSWLSGLTPGASYFLSATLPGRVTTTPPTGSGNIQQYIGEAVSDTAIEFERHEPVEMR